MIIQRFVVTIASDVGITPNMVDKPIEKGAAMLGYPIYHINVEELGNQDSVIRVDNGEIQDIFPVSAESPSVCGYPHGHTGPFVRDPDGYAICQGCGKAIYK
jgi:hypothetical protein